MQPVAIADLRRVIGAHLIVGSEERPVLGIATDSRNLRPGELFFALPGRRFDGHDFVAEALQRGAAGAVVSRLTSGALPPGDYCLLLVEDTLAALQQWARAYRLRFPVLTVGITGSTGKTTTKDLVAQVLSTRWPTVATRGNFNNEIGLPLTLLELGPEHGALVVEMGMRGPGEIAFLCSLAVPQYGIITNIGPAHIERLGSLENIAAAKGELLAGLGNEGLAVLNYDDLYCRSLGERYPCRVCYFGLGEGAEVRAEQIEVTPQGYRFQVRMAGRTQPVSLPLWGRHNVLNALAALALGQAVGLEPEVMAEALSRARISGMRLEPVPGWGGSLILNDAYNANPASVRSALEVLAERRRGRAIAVLGDMLELGDYGPVAHREVGRTCARLGIDLLVTVGEAAREIAAGALAGGMAPERVHLFASPEPAADFLRSHLREGDLVLVKASRALGLESLVRALQTEP
ncbi:MAG: UDP-N-acetylmuramoyl-tripeptide--D-alanyl-D-alanine ligase [Moorellales bacterium]